MSDLAHAATILGRGGVIAHATEGVWGLACDAFDEAAVLRVLALKGRDKSKGLIVIGADADAFAPELDLRGQADRDKVIRSWPGHVTWILPNVRFSEYITGGRDTVAVRVPDHEQARALCAASKRLLVSTSLNPSGGAAVTTYAAACEQFEETVDFVLRGEVVWPGKASQIRTLEGELIRE